MIILREVVVNLKGLTMFTSYHGNLTPYYL